MTSQPDIPAGGCSSGIIPKQAIHAILPDWHTAAGKRISISACTWTQEGPTEAGPLLRDRHPFHSHSMVPGGLSVMSYTTRLISFISEVMRLEISLSTEPGMSEWAAVIPSAASTALTATVLPYVLSSLRTPADLPGSNCSSCPPSRP